MSISTGFSFGRRKEKGTPGYFIACLGRERGFGLKSLVLTIFSNARESRRAFRGLSIFRSVSKGGTRVRRSLEKQAAKDRDLDGNGPCQDERRREVRGPST